MPISYDGALNPLSYVINGSECTLTWTQGRRLASISGEEGTDYTYTYNDEGIRTGKTVNGVEHIYHLSGTQILSEEWTENGVQHLIVYSYDASGSPISMTYRKSTDAATAEEVYFLASNPQGDITYIYDIDGNRVVTYNYDAWGNILSISGTKASTIGRYNPFRYRGYYYDNETGFYYLNSRYYDPSSGRFLNADVYINGNGDLIGFNMFAYCSNNPVMHTDYFGTDIYYDPEEPDWACSYTAEEIEIMREIGFEEFNKLSDEVPRELLHNAIAGEYSQYWSSEEMSNALKKEIGYSNYSKKLEHSLWLNKMSNSFPIQRIPIYGNLLRICNGGSQMIIGVHNKNHVQIMMGAVKNSASIAGEWQNTSE